MNKETKENFIEALFSRPVYVRRVSDSEIQTRCPFCGDSRKKTNDGHLYFNVNLDNNLPIVYHCFLCEESGIVKPSTLTMLDIDDQRLKASIDTLNKTADKIDKKGIINDNKFLFFNYKVPEPTIGYKTEYIENRLGIKLPKEDMKQLKIITSLREFLILNEITEMPCNSNIANNIEKNYVGFLSYGSSHILFRDVTESQPLAWVKYPITRQSMQNRLFYSIESVINIFTDEEIVINLSEGIMDTLSAYYNLGYRENENCLNIAVSGRYYDRIILFLVSMGFVGSNVRINIFADNDESFNRKRQSYTTSLDFYKSVLSNYRNLFGSCYVYYNLSSKDIGVPRDKIHLASYKL